MGELSIGQMAKLNCVSERTLRLYQQKGLLDPVRICDETGYRYYSLDQSPIVDMIQQLQLLGFSLDEIREIKEDRDIDAFELRLKEQVAEIEEGQRRLAISHKLADDFLMRCDVFKNRPLCDQIIFERLPARSIIKFDNPDSKHLSTDNGILAMERWEHNLRYIKKQISERGWPLSLFRNVGCVVPEGRLRTNDLRFDSSFVFVDETFGECYEHAETLPGGEHLTMYCDDVILEDGRDAEIVYLGRMLEYMRHKNLDIAGDYFGEVIAETPLFQFEKREMLFKLSLPVKSRG